MGRLIDADKLIEEIESYRGDIFASEIVELIKQMPTVGEWIPCSERFPEESRKYEVTAYNGYRRVTTQVKWQPKLKTWSLTGAMAYWKIIAWMPLPEPYNPDKE